MTIGTASPTLSTLTPRAALPVAAKEDDPWANYDDVLELQTGTDVASEFAAAQARLAARWAQLQTVLSAAVPAASSPAAPASGE